VVNDREIAFDCDEEARATEDSENDGEDQEKVGILTERSECRANDITLI